MLPSDKTIGIIGGGQLGKMLIEASRPWNVKNIVLENDLNCPAAAVADKVIEGSLYDEEKIQELAAQAEVITFEIEHINCEALKKIEAAGKKVIPSSSVLEIIQNKKLQKQFYTTHQIPTATYIIYKGEQGSALNNLINDLGNTGKVVVKKATGGYDGKGVSIVNKADIVNGTVQLETDDVVEEFHENIVEISVIVARDQFENTTTFPTVEMYFNPRSNLVEFLFSPGTIEQETTAQCLTIAKRTVESFKSPGLFAVELFCLADGRVLVNEMAPRPHNSGHHTIEGCYTSQFEQLNRILLGMPLGNTEMVTPYAAMINLVGPPALNGSYRMSDAETLLKEQGVYIHLYNKATIKPDRKMGHVTLLADSFEAMQSKAERVKNYSGFEQA